MARNNNLTIKVLVNLGFIVVSFVALFPLISLILASFRPSTELMRNGISLTFDPSDLSLKNYIYIFTEGSQY